MIWIRADANKNIGTGHLMRCLSIAAALEKCGQEVCFILADTYPVSLLKEKGFAYQVLQSAYDDMEGELPLLCKWLKEEKPQLLLIDSYFVTKHYFEQVGALVRTAYVDDVNAFPYPVDVLINYNIYGDMLPYREQAAKETTEFLLGTAYVPLREEFHGVEYAVREKAERVLITTGGSDQYNLAGQIVEKALQSEAAGKLQFHIVSGVFNQNRSYLTELEQKHDNIHIHQNVTNMSALMQECDVAVTAGGSTMYELCAVGLPLLCFSFVDNQEMTIKTFARKELAAFCGDYLKEKEKMTEALVGRLTELIGSYEERRAYSLKGKELVDGRGAERIAKALCEIN